MAVISTKRSMVVDGDAVVDVDLVAGMVVDVVARVVVGAVGGALSTVVQPSATTATATSASETRCFIPGSTIRMTSFTSRGLSGKLFPFR
jgi:hypothetical protein